MKQISTDCVRGMLMGAFVADATALSYMFGIDSIDLFDRKRVKLTSPIDLEKSFTVGQISNYSNMIIGILDYILYNDYDKKEITNLYKKIENGATWHMDELTKYLFYDCDDKTTKNRLNKINENHEIKHDEIKHDEIKHDKSKNHVNKKHVNKKHVNKKHESKDYKSLSCMIRCIALCIEEKHDIILNDLKITNNIDIDIECCLLYNYTLVCLLKKEDTETIFENIKLRIKTKQIKDVIYDIENKIDRNITPNSCLDALYCSLLSLKIDDYYLGLKWIFQKCEKDNFIGNAILSGALLGARFGEEELYIEKFRRCYDTITNEFKDLKDSDYSLYNVNYFEMDVVDELDKYIKQV